MLKGQACAKFQSQIFDESEVIQIVKVVRWHFCQVYLHLNNIFVKHPRKPQIRKLYIGSRAMVIDKIIFMRELSPLMKIKNQND